MPNDNDIIIGIVTTTVIFFLFSVFTIIYFLAFRQNKKKHREEMIRSKKEYEQQLLQAQIEVQENTYKHVAKELHDNVGQLLSTAKLLMGVTEIKLSHAPDTLLTANATLTKAIQELRLFSRSLDREWLEQFNFLDNLYSEVERINSSEAIKAKIDCSAIITIKPKDQIILFRIVQEAVQNAIKHAAPSQLSIIINNGHDLEVQVINDGKSLPANFQGMGTTNMRNRAKLFGGNVLWKSNNNNETVVSIFIPLNQTHEN